MVGFGLTGGKWFILPTIVAGFGPYEILFGLYFLTFYIEGTVMTKIGKEAWETYKYDI